LSYPSGERELHEDQIPQEHLGRQACFTPEYPARLVQLTALEQRSPTQDHYFAYQQSDRYSEQATEGGFAELVPFRSQFKPASTPGQAAQISGFQGCHKGCPVEETNHDQDRAVEHTCTVLEQEQRFSLCYQPHNRQVSNASACHIQVIILMMINTKRLDRQ